MARGNEPSRRKPRRAPTACDFCRHRKMRCNNEKPQCRNCKEHGKQCVYAELVKKPRDHLSVPTISRISQLEQENKQLRESLASLTLQITTDKSPEDALNTRIADSTSGFSGTFKSGVQARSLEFSCTPAYTTPSSDATSTQKAYSPDKESNFHGPTSAVFDEKSTEAETCHESKLAAKVPEIWVERQLVAESASQRQLEAVNLAAGKLDFDGTDPDLGMHLLAIYWKSQHSSSPFVYRTAFMRDMACAGPFFSKLLLNAIFHSASKDSPRAVVRTDPNNRFTTGWMFRQRATELLNKEFEKSSITTIQALLIMSGSLFSWCDEKSRSWLYAGMAFNMIVDLGIHVNTVTLKKLLSEEETEVRLRVFWAAYSLDKTQSLYQGRPARLHGSSTNLPLRFLDKHAELELYSPLSNAEGQIYPVSPVYSISKFIEVCKLSAILEKILFSLYTENSSSRKPGELLQERNALLSELESWRGSLPQHLDIKSSDSGSLTPLPNTLHLLAMFNVFVILLHRPFVSNGHLHFESSSIARDAFSTCCTAASEIDRILQAYQDHYPLESSPYIMSYATYVSATIHVRLAAQSAPRSDAHKALSRCLDVLEIQQTVCWAPRRGRRVIEALVARFGVVMEEAKSLENANTGLPLPDFDIDEIIRSFSRNQPLDMPHNQHSLEFAADAHATSVDALRSSTAVAYGSRLHDANDMPLGSDDTYLLYDPLYGFGGSDFLDLDFGFEENYPCGR